MPPPSQEKHKSSQSDPYEHYDLSGKISTVLKSRGVPEIYLSAALQRPELSQDDVSYFFHGPVGTGKTHRAVAIMREMILRKSRPYKIDTCVRGIYDAWFYPVNTLLLRIKSSFAQDAQENEEELIRRITSHSLIVLDDMGTEKITDWTLQTMRTIMDILSREKKQVIITSNWSPDVIARKMDDRIASRIYGMCGEKNIIGLSGKDRRLG